MSRVIVKMGSNRVGLQITGNYLNSTELVLMTLVKCGMKSNAQLAHTYVVYESLNGVERPVRSNENLVDAESSIRHRVKPEYVLRKIRPNGRQAVSKSVESSTVESTKPNKGLTLTVPESKSTKTFEILKTAYSRIRDLKRQNTSMTSQKCLIDVSNSCGNSDDEESSLESSSSTENSSQLFLIN